MKLSQELLNARRERIDKRKFYEDETRSGRLIRNLGLIILFIFIIRLVYNALFSSVPIKLANWEIIQFLIGLFILILGIKLIDKASQSDLSVDEEVFLNVCDSLEYIDRYLTKDKKEWLRKKAFEKLAKVEKEIVDAEISDNEGNPYFLWNALTIEVNENMHLLKQNFNERLLPSITKGYEEDLKKAYSIIDILGKFLLNPTNSELNDLNKSMSQLKLVKTENFSLIHFFDRHPNMYLPSIIAIFIIIASLFSFISLMVFNVSKDTALSVGVILFSGLIALTNLIKRKS